jgi:hypothetical protein
MLFTNKPHHLPHTVTVGLPNLSLLPHQVPPQYAHHTPHTSCDLQIGLCRGSGYQCGVPVTVPISTGRRVGFVQDEVPLAQVTVRVIRFSPVSIIPPTFHTHLHKHFSVTRRTSGRSLGNFNSFSEIGESCVGKCCKLCCGFQRNENIQSLTVAIIVVYIHTCQYASTEISVQKV